MNVYGDARGYALAVVATQGLYMAAVVANLGVVFAILGGFTAFDPYGGPSDVAVFITFFIAALTFAVWTWRVVGNARSFEPSMNATPGWAIGWYFVPVASLWKPYSYLEETWDASSPTMRRHASTLLRWWWGLWLASGIAGAIGNAFSRAEQATGEMGPGFVLVMLSLIVRLGVSVLVMRISLRLAAMQREKRRGGGAEAEVFA